MTAVSRPPRAVRRYSSAAIPDAHIGQMLEAARWTGSARNRQPWRFIVARDGALRRRLASCGAYAQHLASAPLVVGLAVDPTSGSDADFDVGRLAQSLMSAAAELGYGSCPATFFPTENVRAAGRAVDLPEPWRLRWALAIGHPVAEQPSADARAAIPIGRLAVRDLTIWR